MARLSDRSRQVGSQSPSRLGPKRRSTLNWGKMATLSARRQRCNKGLVSCSSNKRVCSYDLQAGKPVVLRNACLLTSP
eukprot:scaffold471549_cov18-Prasinocladus_malaysianus.AAC.1